ncbi:hypothetical protein [Roseofilum capinflatum]|uniref:Uncharacterized protein n=1 Tax=Roseofilum capinflatum BLCC-M114 TaxID=3022440 RepID=A0ABT7B3M1_9CYAN|nr:hypothetical protein [Roseofilum capinflatum]MDJ1173392.1 hypothetical protein [Roseofilum capinflatum BLCC-M114]
MTKTYQEIVNQGYQALIDSLGIVDAIRFIQYLNPGKENYTQDRDRWLSQHTLPEIFETMRQQTPDNPQQYDEIIE